MVDIYKGEEKEKDDSYIKIDGVNIESVGLH